MEKKKIEDYFNELSPMLGLVTIIVFFIIFFGLMFVAIKKDGGEIENDPVEICNNRIQNDNNDYPNLPGESCEDFLRYSKADCHDLNSPCYDTLYCSK